MNNQSTPQSPDLSKMEIRVYDPAMKTILFFRNQERYDRYLNKLKNADPVVMRKGGRKNKKNAQAEIIDLPNE